MHVWLLVVKYLLKHLVERSMNSSNNVQEQWCSGYPAAQLNSTHNDVVVILLHNFIQLTVMYWLCCCTTSFNTQCSGYPAAQLHSTHSAVVVILLHNFIQHKVMQWLSCSTTSFNKALT